MSLVLCHWLPEVARGPGPGPGPGSYFKQLRDWKYWSLIFALTASWTRESIVSSIDPYLSIINKSSYSSFLKETLIACSCTIAKLTVLSSERSLSTTRKLATWIKHKLFNDSLAKLGYANRQPKPNTSSWGGMARSHRPTTSSYLKLIGRGTVGGRHVSVHPFVSLCLLFLREKGDWKPVALWLSIVVAPKASFEAGFFSPSYSYEPEAKFLSAESLQTLDIAWCNDQIRRINIIGHSISQAESFFQPRGFTRVRYSDSVRNYIEHLIFDIRFQNVDGWHRSLSLVVSFWYLDAAEDSYSILGEIEATPHLQHVTRLIFLSDTADFRFWRIDTSRKCKTSFVLSYLFWSISGWSHKDTASSTASLLSTMMMMFDSKCKMKAPYLNTQIPPPQQSHETHSVVTKIYEATNIWFQWFNSSPRTSLEVEKIPKMLKSWDFNNLSNLISDQQNLTSFWTSTRNPTRNTKLFRVQNSSKALWKQVAL